MTPFTLVEVMFQFVEGQIALANPTHFILVIQLTHFFLFQFDEVAHLQLKLFLVLLNHVGTVHFFKFTQNYKSQF